MSKRGPASAKSCLPRPPPPPPAPPPRRPAQRPYDPRRRRRKSPSTPPHMRRAPGLSSGAGSARDPRLPAAREAAMARLLHPQVHLGPTPLPSSPPPPPRTKWTRRVLLPVLTTTTSSPPSADSPGRPAHRAHRPARARHSPCGFRSRPRRATSSARNSDKHVCRSRVTTTWRERDGSRGHAGRGASPGPRPASGLSRPRAWQVNDLTRDAIVSGGGLDLLVRTFRSSSRPPCCAQNRLSPFRTSRPLSSRFQTRASPPTPCTRPPCAFLSRTDAPPSPPWQVAAMRNHPSHPGLLDSCCATLLSLSVWAPSAPARRAPAPGRSVGWRKGRGAWGGAKDARRAATPPPLVLSGHAASLTPY